MTEIVEHWGLRLRTFREHKDVQLSRNEVGEAIGKSQGAISEMERQNRPQLVVGLAEFLAAKGCNLNWLITGKGSMFLDAPGPLTDEEGAGYWQKTERLHAVADDGNSYGYDIKMKFVNKAFPPGQKRPKTLEEWVYQLDQRLNEYQNKQLDAGMEQFERIQQLELQLSQIREKQSQSNS